MLTQSYRQQLSWKFAMCLLVSVISITGFGTLSQAAPAKILKMAVLQLEPYGFLTSENQLTGILYDAGKLITTEAGFGCEFDLVPLPRAIKQIELGEADFAIMFPNEAIQQVSIPVAPILSVRIVIIGQPGTQYASLEALRGKIVANVRDAKYDEAFSADTAIEKYWTTDYQQSLEMFTRKRVDAVIGPEVGLLSTAKRMGLPQAVFGQPFVLSTRDAILFFSKKMADDATITALKSAIERLRQQGKLEELMLPYLPQ